MTKYQHLSAEERAAIMIERARNTSVRAIARLLEPVRIFVGEAVEHQVIHAPA